MRRCGTNEIFAVASAGDGAGPIIRISAGADHRCVAYSSRHLVCCSARRSCRGQIAVSVQRDRSYGAVSILIGDYKAFPVTARAVLLGGLHLLQSVPSLL